MVDTGAVNLGSAYGEFLVDTSRVEQQLNTAFGRMDQHAGNLLTRVGDKLQGVGDKIAGWGVAITRFMAPVGVALGIGIKTFGTFEDALAEIKARTGATAEQMAQVQAKALEMGAATKYSSTQAAEAMLQLLSSGYDLNETFAALPAVLDAAAAGGMDLGYTADVVTDALAMWNLGAKDAGRVSDALARGAAASSAEINDLAMGLGNVGPMAASFGLSIEDTIAILAAFSERGIKGAEAGTALRSMLTNMTSDAKPVVDMWKKLGISMFDAQGQIRPIGNVLADLREKLATMTPEERVKAIDILAGTFGKMGLEVLTSSDALGDMKALMGEQSDAATVAAARMDTLNGRLESAKGSLEALMIVGLKPFIEKYLKPGLTTVTSLINKLTVWAEKNPKIITQIVKLVTLLIALGPAMIGVGKIMHLIGTLLLSLTNPINILILGGLLLYEAWSSNFGGLRDILQPIVNVLDYVFYWLKLSFESVAAQSGVLAGLVDAWNSLFYVYQDGKTTFFSKILQAFGVQKETAEKVGLAIVNLKNILAQAFDLIAGVVTGTLIPALEKIKDWIIKTGFPAVVSFIENKVLPAFGKVVNFFEDHPGFITALLAVGAAIAAWQAAQLLLNAALAAWALIQVVINGLMAVFDLALSPLLLPLLLIAALVYAYTQNLWGFRDAVDGFGKSLREGIKSWGENIDTGLQILASLVIRTAIKMAEMLAVLYVTWKVAALVAREIGKAIHDEIDKALDPLIPDSIDPLVDALLRLQDTWNTTKTVLGVGAGVLEYLVGKAVGKASGGPVLARMPYLVGEQGPELFVPSSSGQIIPNDQLMGGDTFNITVQITPDTLQRYPQAADYGRDAAQEFVKQLKSAQVKAGGGIVG